MFGKKKQDLSVKTDRELREIEIELGQKNAKNLSALVDILGIFLFIVIIWIIVIFFNSTPTGV